MSAEDTVPRNPGLKLQPSGERRQLTVMFCDLLGSTEVSAALDPEELSEILRLYREQVTAIVAVYGGWIAQYLGDGVLAYFGYPQAKEDDAECAVRAGIEIARRLPAVAHPKFRFNVRLGVATGLVVIGDAPRVAPDGLPLAIGETPNLAARLQAMAPPNGMLIAESTRRLVGNLFDLKAPVALKVAGFMGAVSAYEVIGAAAVESRFDALRGEMTPFVGREDEIALLRRRWEQTCEGEGRVVLLSGEAGIGKSRILDRVRKDFGIPSEHCLRFSCSPLHTQTALSPFLGSVRKAAGLSEDASDAENLAALAHFYESAVDDPWGAAEALSEILGIAWQSERYTALPAQQRKDAAVTAILDYPLALARRHPLLIILEDAHWIDPTSVELLDRLIAMLPQHRILLIVSGRPDYQAVWATDPGATLISLSRFGPHSGAAIIAGVIHGKTLPPELIEQILEKSDGVPLFIEELTKSLLDSGWLDETPGGYVLHGPLRALALPDTLQDLLTARLDRLGAMKAVVQIGSVIGREFSHRLLQSIAGLSDAEMEEALSRLLASGLIYRRGIAPDATYFFKHALIQDAAYNTLLRKRRQQIHARIANTILEKFPAIAATQPEVIAHHLTAAEDPTRAIHYWLIAGKAQTRASASREAISHLRRGISLLGSIENAEQRQQARLRLETLIGALAAVSGPSAVELAELFEQGLEPFGDGGASPMVFPFLYGQFTYSISTGKTRQAKQIALKFLRLAEEADYPAGYVLGRRMLGVVQLGLAEWQDARRTFEEALAAYQPERDDHVAYLFGQNSRIYCQTLLSMVLFCLGDDLGSLRLGKESIKAAIALNHPHTLAVSISYAGCWVNCLRGAMEELHVQAQRLVDVSRDFGLPLYAPIGQFFLGLSFHAKGDVDRGIDHMEQAISLFEQTNFRLALPGYLGFLAGAKCESGQIAEAGVLCARAKAAAEQSGEMWILPEILCVEAAIAMRSDPANAETARALIDAAIRRSRELDSPAFEGRCIKMRDRLFAEGAAPAVCE